MNKCNFIAGTVLSGILAACPSMARAAEQHAGAAGAAVEECDIVVYGSTPAAISAAVQAKRMGKTCVVVSPETRIGGLTTGGLGQTDIGNKAAFGGIALEFYRAVADHYRDGANWKWQSRHDYLPDGQCAGTKGADSMWTFEPSAALKILEGWEKRDGLRIVRGKRLCRERGKVKVEKAGRGGERIVSFLTEDGTVYRGKMFVDATYEGDLMAAAGVAYTFGREANAQYGETLNGTQVAQARFHQFPKGVDPYVVPGDPKSGLLPNVEAGPIERDGTGDRRVQAYCFRMCLTDVPENRIPFAKPDGYDERAYELLFRMFAAKPAKALAGDLTWKLPWINSKMPNRKTDTNNRDAFSTDFIGRNWNWPEASYAEREAILAAHLRYQRGLMWTLANHPRVPEVVRREVSKWGTCKDEFADGLGDGWQRQLYVREARRMVGDYVVTELDCTKKRTTRRPVAMAAYTMDSHNVRRYVGADGFVHNEGDVEVDYAGGPFGIDYGAIVPKRGECANLFVPVCLSASHIAFGAIRMEPVFFALGQAAATAAAQAIDAGCAAQALPYGPLAARLILDGQVLWTGEPPTELVVAASNSRAFERKTAAQPSARVEPATVVCKSRYIGWPSLARLRDGTLMASFSGSRIEHVCPSGVVQVVRSTDNGKTWSAPLTIGDTPIDDRDASITELPNGEILVIWFTSLAYYGNTYWPTRGGTLDTRPIESLDPYLGRWCVRSRDGGKTWTKPEKMTLRGFTPHGPCVLKDGSLLYVGHWVDTKGGRGGSGSNGRYYISAERSTDGGRTWELLCEKFPTIGNESDHCEPHVTELPDGKLVAVIRYGGGDCSLRVSESTDGGRTWTPMRKTDLRCGGSPAHLLTLPDGRIVATYAIRAHWDAKNGYPGIGEFVSVSSDGGKTWSAADGICLRRTPARTPAANMGYPATVRLPSGEFYTVFYEPEKTGQNPCLMGVRWSLDASAVVTGRLAPIGPGYRRADRQFGGIPSVAVSPKNGRLWRTYYAGPTNGEDSNNYVVLSTRTGTNDWQDVLYFDPDGLGPVRSFDPEVWIAPDGKLHWTWTDREVFGLRDGDKNRWAPSWSAKGDHLRGVTLDAENPPVAPYPAPRTLVQAGGVMMCKPIVARDGSWLYPVAFWNDDFSARIYRSTDGGQTLVPVGGATLPVKNREFEEHNVVELKDGTLRVYMRAKCNGAWNAWQADSHDGGRTWDAAKPCPFPHPNSRFFVRRLASGALLLVKNGSLVPPTTPNGAFGNREDMTAYVSDDDGATWKGGLLLHKGQCAYPDGDQAPDGTIHVTFDGDRYQKQEIFHVSFTEADVRN